MNGENTAPAAADMPPWHFTADEFVARAGGDRTSARRQYRDALRQPWASHLPTITRVEEARGVVKFVARLDPRTAVESVIVPMDSYRGARWRTLCVSTQAGCRMGCVFCETGRMGLVRHLTAAEIVAQRLCARALLLKRHGTRDRPYRYDLDGIRNIVFMGMGEPLDNCDQLFRAIEILADPGGIAFPCSHMTISTVGVARGLTELAERARDDPRWRKLRIAVSIHAANDALRSRLVPANRALPLLELRKLLLAYPLPPRGRFLVQYVMLRGVNDTPAHARELAAWCQGLPCVVNLIPYNPQRHAAFAAPEESTVLGFLRTLRSLGVFTKRRTTHGQDIAAACGQLADAACPTGTHPDAERLPHPASA